MGKTGKEFKGKDWRKGSSKKYELSNEDRNYEELKKFAKDNDMEVNNMTTTGNKTYNKGKNGKKFGKGGKKFAPKATHPVAKFLRNFFRDQIMEFLMAPPEERNSASRKLFTMEGHYPARLQNYISDDADKYLAYIVIRDVPSKKIDAENFAKCTCTIVVIDERTSAPAFVVTAFTTPSGEGNVKIYPQTEKGPDYYNVIWWDSRSPQDKEEPLMIPDAPAEVIEVEPDDDLGTNVEDVPDSETTEVPDEDSDEI